MRSRVNAGPLEHLIDEAGLYINNELGVPNSTKRNTRNVNYRHILDNNQYGASGDVDS